MGSAGQTGSSSGGGQGSRGGGQQRGGPGLLGSAPQAHTVVAAQQSGGQA